ncbi:hypothetical protein ACIHFD_18670 [Nonomuraea sp. NPDC051941]|uniref:hypothetical protein n=1 Tax=Nonomuraea sp. NPDC051941 TaxID=3364373 RepID=UPI0037C64705
MRATAAHRPRRSSPGERLAPGTDILLRPYVIRRFFDDRFDPGRAHHIPRKA